MGSHCKSSKKSRVELRSSSASQSTYSKMKYLVVLVVLLGFACGKEEEEVSLQDIENEAFPSARQTTLDPNLLIGNVVAALGGLNTTDISALIKGLLGGAGGLGGTTAILGGIPAGVLGIKGAVSAIVSIIAGIIMVPVGIANQILALVGLVFLVLYLISGANPGDLIARSSSIMPEFNTDFFNFDMVNNPVVESVSQMFFAALEKYDH